MIASLLGFVEVAIWVTAVAKVVQSLDNPLNVLGWAGGFATGNAVGIWIERRVALGDLVIRIISRGKGAKTAEAIRELGQPVTELDGKGREGPVQLLYVVADRAHAERIEETARAVDPDLILVAEDARDVHLHQRPVLSQPMSWRTFLKKK